VIQNSGHGLRRIPAMMIGTPLPGSQRQEPMVPSTLTEQNGGPQLGEKNFSPRRPPRRTFPATSRTKKVPVQERKHHGNPTPFSTEARAHGRDIKRIRFSKVRGCSIRSRPPYREALIPA